MKESIIVYVSSRNNYDMVEGAVLKNIKLNGYEFVNVDDGSSDIEISKGKEQSKRIGFTFLENKKCGVQYATQTVIDWVNENRPNCKYVVCFQHDNYPITDNFFDSMEHQVKLLENEKVGLIGFNHLDNGSYTGDALKRYNRNEDNVKGILGLCHLSIKDNRKRWLCPVRQPELIKHIKFNKGYFVGDKLSDLKAAHKVGAVPVLVRTGHGLETEKELNKWTYKDIKHRTKVFDDLATFVESLS